MSFQKVNTLADWTLNIVQVIHNNATPQLVQSPHVSSFFSSFEQTIGQWKKFINNLTSLFRVCCVFFLFSV